MLRAISRASLTMITTASLRRTQPRALSTCPPYVLWRLMSVQRSYLCLLTQIRSGSRVYPSATDKKGSASVMSTTLTSFQQRLLEFLTDYLRAGTKPTTLTYQELARAMD